MQLPRGSRWRVRGLVGLAALAGVLVAAPAIAGQGDGWGGQPPPGAHGTSDANPPALGTQPPNPRPDLSGLPTQVNGPVEGTSPPVAGGGSREDTGGIDGSDAPGGRED